MTTYHYLLASQKFLLEEEPLEEVLNERIRHYKERNKEIDFWLVKQPAFLEASSLSKIKSQVPAKSVAIISTNEQFIIWLKLRLEYVLLGKFETPLEGIEDPLASVDLVA
jgi:hypothetical protein